MTLADCSVDEKKIIRDIVEKTKALKIIPVIGYELYNGHPSLEIDNQIENNFLKWFSQKLIEEPDRFNIDIKNKLNLDYPCCIDYVNACYDNLNSDEKFTAFGDDIKRVYDNYIKTMEIPLSIVKLAKIECFRFYIDTSIFNFLEKAITTYRLSRDVDKENYAILKPGNMKLDASFLNTNATPIESLEPLKKFTKPVIWDFFGACKENEGIINMTNIHMQEVLFNYIKDHEKSGYEDLRSIFKEVGFLILGCPFNDWIFRFILRLLAFDKLDLGKLKHKFLSDELFIKDADKSRNLYINETGMHSMKIPPGDLINIIYSQLQDHCIVKKTKLNSCLIFISFYGENRDFANQVYDYLTSTWALECFLDEINLNGGDRLNDEIAAAIDNCAVFIPIVSNELDRAADKEAYVFAEWVYAIKKEKPLVIMPIYTKDFNLNQLIKIKTDRYKDIQPILYKSNLGGMILNDNKIISDFFCEQVSKHQYNCKIKQ